MGIIMTVDPQPRSEVRPLMLGVLLLAALLVLFTTLLWVVAIDTAAFTVDRYVDELFATHRQPPLTLLFLWLTYLGKGPVIAVCALLTGAVLLWRGSRQYLVALAIALGGAEASVQLIKRAVGRARPDPHLAYHVELTFSFPSAHATLAAAFYGMLAYMIMQEVENPVQRRVALSATILMAVGIAVSRLYLGVHYLSDVAAGFLLGLSWVLVGMIAIELRAESVE